MILLYTPQYIWFKNRKLPFTTSITNSSPFIMMFGIGDYVLLLKYLSSIHTIHCYWYARKMNSSIQHSWIRLDISFATLLFIRITDVIWTIELLSIYNQSFEPIIYLRKSNKNSILKWINISIEL